MFSFVFGVNENLRSSGDLLTFSTYLRGFFTLTDNTVWQTKKKGEYAIKNEFFCGLSGTSPNL